MALSRLADLVANGRKVVAVDRRRARCHGARRALRAVLLVARDAILGRHAGADHLQRIELAGNLEQRTCILGHLVHLAHVAGNDPHASLAFGAGAAGYSGAQIVERCQLELADSIAADAAGVGTDTFTGVYFAVGSGFADTYDATGYGAGGAANAGNLGAVNLFEGQGGNDVITGNGNTQIRFDGATALVTVDLAVGTVTGNGSVGQDTFTGVNRVFGSNFNDTISGASTDDFLDGGNNGNDTISGRGGNDSILGGNGNDTIDGGTGSDLMNGGAGSDTFVYASVQDSAVAGPQDVISNFDAASDSFRFVSSPNLQFASAQITFVQGTQFTGDGVHSEALTVTDASSNTFLQVDTDADGNADMQVQLDGLNGQLTNGNFLIV